MRGLKYEIRDRNLIVDIVAPFMGAWIEIQKPQAVNSDFGRRTLYGCVD